MFQEMTILTDDPMWGPSYKWAEKAPNFWFLSQQISAAPPTTSKPLPGALSPSLVLSYCLHFSVPCKCLPPFKTLLSGPPDRMAYYLEAAGICPCQKGLPSCYCLASGFCS